MKLIKNLFKLLFLWPLFFICKYLPKNKAIWCFGAPRERFNDNSKYMFLYAQKHYPDITCYWVTTDKKLTEELNQRGFQVIDRSSLIGIWTIARSNCIFYSCFVSEVSFWLTAGAKAVNLWHGLPLKKIEFDISNGEYQKKYSKAFSLNKLAWQLFNPVSFRRPDIMFSPTPIFTAIFKRAFRIKKGKIIDAGSPRTDIFFDKGLDPVDLVTYPDIISSKKQGNKTFLYMPTFRDVGGDFFESTGIDFAQLNEKMLGLNAIFYIKAHPNAGLDSFKLDHYEHIKVVPSTIDPYPLMNHVDTLITDYSSIYIDFLLLNKPIIFFAFDLESYQATCRDMYFEYDDVTPGHRALNFKDLLFALAEDDVYANERLALKNKFWGKEYRLGYKALAEECLKELV
jgi:CDP-glycerol glycerophosphotransferase (TagB/SpsB family)